MKKLALILLITVALAGCGGAQEALPTYTPLPTYTLLPTYTEAPTETATFLPPPTEVPLETPTVDPALAGTPTLAAPPTTTGTQAILAFGSNLREGPGRDFEIITPLNAGEALLILGRNQEGDWIFCRTSSGLEGWVAITQVQGPLDIPRIPLAVSIPTPAVTRTPTVGGNVTGTPGSGTTTTPGTPSVSSSAEPAPAGNFFEVVAGDPQKCVAMEINTIQRYPVDSPTAPILAFNAVSAATISDQKAFKFDRILVPQFIDVTVPGPVMPGGCNAENTCNLALFDMCYFSPSSAPTGGTDYERSVTLQIGTQSFSSFFEDVAANFVVTFRVVAP